EAGGRGAGHRMLADLVDGRIQHHFARVVLDGELSGDLELALAGGFHRSAAEGGLGELCGVEEVIAQQVVVERLHVRLQARQRQRHFNAGGGNIVGVVDDAAVDVAEQDHRVGKAEVVPLDRKSTRLNSSHVKSS